MPTRKSIWLYDYDHVKYRTRLQWTLSFAAGFVLAVFGCIGFWSIVIRQRSEGGLDTGILAVSAMCIASAVIELPAALVYFYRRRRGELTNCFDYEVIDDQEGSHRDHHGPDH